MKSGLRIGETPGAEEDAFRPAYIITAAQESSIYKIISVREPQNKFLLRPNIPSVAKAQLHFSASCKVVPFQNIDLCRGSLGLL